MENYKVGEFVYKDGVNMGQFVENINDFIVKDKDFLKSALLSMGNYAVAVNKKNKEETFSIFSKRSIFHVDFGSLEQFLIKTDENDLVWKELLIDDYTIIEVI